MCGIVGIVNFKNNVQPYTTALKRALSALSRRGPDYHDVYINAHVAFGHTRLAVIDTSVKAHQPFHDTSGNYVVTFNGEIYNFKEIKQKLENEGYTFTTNSDTEVLLSAYICFGIDFIHKLNGDFAFAIYDKIKKHVLIARDRFGIKPLVFYKNDSELIFSSEIKGVLPFLSHKPKISQTALHYYLHLNYIPAPYTIYNNIFKLKPGHYILINESDIQIKQYYTIPKEQIQCSLPENQIFDKFKKLLITSVKRRLVSDVPLGTFLSGGIDSSIVSAIAKEFKTDLNTFTVKFEGYDFFDESKDAEVIAKHIGSKHFTISVTEKNVMEIIPEILDYLDEPFADSSAIAVSALAKHTRKHITVALSGDGADELFGGYWKHRAHKWVFNHKNLKGFIKTAALLSKAIPSSRNGYFSNKSRQIKKLSEGMSVSSDARYWRWACFNNQQSVNKILLNHLKYFNYNELLKTKAQTINEVLYNDLHLVLPNDMLFKTDSMSMMHSLEIRVPMLDHEVVNFVAQLPENYKINNKTQKYILKKTFGQLLPPNILTKPKHGFEIPLHLWLKGNLNRYVVQYLNKKIIQDQNLFNFNEINKKIKQLESFNPSDSAFHIWNLIVFEHWYINKYL